MCRRCGVGGVAGADRADPVALTFCSTCGYRHVGDTSERCPECATEVTPSTTYTLGDDEPPGGGWFSLALPAIVMNASCTFLMACLPVACVMAPAMTLLCLLWAWERSGSVYHAHVARRVDRTGCAAPTLRRLRLVRIALFTVTGAGVLMWWPIAEYLTRDLSW